MIAGYEPTANSPAWALYLLSQAVGRNEVRSDRPSFRRAVGGDVASALARLLMLPVSKDTLLRVVRRHVNRYPNCIESGSEPRIFPFESC